MAEDLCSGNSLNLQFAPCIYKFIVDTPITYHGVEIVDRQLYNPLDWTMNNAIDDTQIDVTITLDVQRDSLC